jgi:hypothetical protein
MVKGLCSTSPVCRPIRWSSQSWQPVMTIMGICFVLLCPRNILYRETPSRLGNPTSNRIRLAPSCGIWSLASCPSVKKCTHQRPSHSNASRNKLMSPISSSTTAIKLPEDSFLSTSTYYPQVDRQIWPCYDLIDIPQTTLLDVIHRFGTANPVSLGKLLNCGRDQNLLCHLVDLAPDLTQCTAW